MILKNVKGEILFIEATSDQGVAVYSWRSFVKHKCFQYYDKTVYRPLIFPRTYELLLQVQEFQKKVIGMKYKLNPLRLLQKYSNNDSVKYVAEKNGYFCSELIAAIYKLIGLLPRHIRSSQYLPGSFSAESNLVLQNNAEFGDEYLIEFSE
jgi:hypothetical protein